MRGSGMFTLKGLAMRLPFDRRSGIMLGIALGAGLLAVWAARQHIQGRILQIEAESKVPTVQRVVAAYDLPAGIRLSSDHLAVRSFPVALAASDSVAPDA